nr:MmpL4 protein [Mycolicibacterium fortuitum subsp. fortuitum DSM 46621 = ATCC 6841 = JCM 6387]
MTPSIAAALGRWFWWPLNTFEITRQGRLDRERKKLDESTAPIPTTTA